MFWLPVFIPAQNRKVYLVSPLITPWGKDVRFTGIVFQPSGGKRCTPIAVGGSCCARSSPLFW